MKRVSIFPVLSAGTLVIVTCATLAACAGILGLTRTTSDAAFPHRAHVLAGVACTSCHKDVDKPGPALHLPDDATCTTCHAKPHDTHSCTGCHVAPTAVAELVEARDHLKFEHTRHLGVANGNCMRCHTGVSQGDARIRPVMATCFKCHDAERDARNCNACHRDLSTENTLPASHLAHDGDWLREHGTRAASSGDLCQTCHKESFCASCHGKTVPVLPAKLQFADPMRASLHRAGFTARHALEARSDPAACATCHTPDRCLSCHVAKSVASVSSSPHPAGWVGLAASDNRHGGEARRDPVSCAGCHSGAGEALCVSCHAVGGVGGNPHQPGFSSRLPITALPCRLCHTIGRTR